VDLLTFLSPKQREAFDLLTDPSNSGGIAFWRVGTGKTRIAIATGIAMLQATSMKAQMIAVVCRRAAFYDWRTEIATLQLSADTPEIEALAESEQVFNVDSFVLVSDGLLRNAKIISTLQKLIDWGFLGALLVDEGYLFCNPQSQRSKGLYEIAKRLPTVVVSGSIQPSRDLTQVYGQAVAANKHKRITPTLTKFRQEYQTGIQGQFYAYYPKPGAYKKLMEKMSPFTHLYMPPKKDREWKETILKIKPTDYQLELLKELKDTMAIDAMFELTNAANMIQKGQQISNGWLKGEDGDVRYFESSKVDRTVALMQEILAENKRVVIWCAFREDIRRLKREFLETEAISPKEVSTLQSGETFSEADRHKCKHKVS
jgi:hypothetical protein